jgi:hypothetical protein
MNILISWYFTKPYKALFRPGKVISFVEISGSDVKSKYQGSYLTMKLGEIKPLIQEGVLKPCQSNKNIDLMIDRGYINIEALEASCIRNSSPLNRYLDYSRKIKSTTH